MNEHHLHPAHPSRSSVTPRTNLAAAGPQAWIPVAPTGGMPTGDLAMRGDLLPAPFEAPPHQATTSHAAEDPLAIALDALTAWNAFLRTNDPRHQETFIHHAQWLLTHEIVLPEDGGGWPTRAPLAGGASGAPHLSASVQSAAISVLLRAYQQTADTQYAAAAQRAGLTLQRDILDGGVLAPIGREIIWFEDSAIYPAAHGLEGFLRAWLALFDCAAIAQEPEALALLERAHASFHALAQYYDAGYTTREELLRERPADAAAHRRHTAYLETLVQFTGCQQCAETAKRWRRYTRNPIARIRAGRPRTRKDASAQPASTPSAPSGIKPVCVPITAYPVAGGMRSVLTTWRAAMTGSWQMEFLTRVVGPDTEGQTIYAFDVQHAWPRLKLTSPAHFPQVWLYDWVGYRKLRRLLRAPSTASNYSAILPQDGIFTGAYAGIAARLAGIPVIPVDHGNVHALFNPDWHQELLAPLRSRALPRRIIGRARLRLYWRSLRLLAWLSTHMMEHALVASDDIAEAYQRHLKVPAHRITRFPFVVDADRYAPAASTARTTARARLGVPEDAIVIVMVNRLAPEKDLETAVAAIHATYTRLPADIQPRLRVIIAGDGPLREQVAREIERLSLDPICQLTGEASASQVATLLSLSDIFLYTGRRGINSMAILEAMSAGCAVVGTTSTRHIAEYLADGRGHAVPAGDVAAVRDALHDLVMHAPARARTGQLARDYVLRHHTAEALRRCLWRVTGWAPDLSQAQPRKDMPNQYEGVH